MDSDSDDVFVGAHTPKTAQKRGPKVDRATDPRTPWSRTDWDGHVQAKLREGSWHTYYHMPVASFDKLHALLFCESDREKDLAISRAQNSTPMGAIVTQVKLASTLRQYFGEKHKSMVDVFKISSTSCHAAFLNVTERINTTFDGDLYATDHSDAVLAARAHAFAQRSAYPTIMRHCVGAIDGLLIKTIQPKAQEVGNVRSFYSGHKKGFGVNMQGVCDSQCRFIGFSCNTAGSTSDYVAFRHGFFYGHWPSLPAPFYYIGDCAYPLSPKCLTPYVGTQLPPDQDAFNFFHSQMRITIERTFGIFVNVFSIFQTPLKFTIANTCNLVEACVKLHNYRIDEGCQHVTRKATSGAIFREAWGRSDDVFDILDDARYLTHRPHATDASYAQHVAGAEMYSGLNPSDAPGGIARRAALTEALHQAGAARPAANVIRE